MWKAHPAVNFAPVKTKKWLSDGKGRSDPVNSQHGTVLKRNWPGM